MPKDKISVQDIADSLGLSRTTVSKALNGNSKIPPKTRDMVWKRAAELKYKQFAYLSLPNDPAPSSNNAGSGHFALLAHVMPDKFHIGSSLMASLEQEISHCNYTLSVHILLDKDIGLLHLPNNFDMDKIDAIVCIEMFDPAYSRLLCSLGKPIVFVDTFHTEPHENLNADIFLMESKYSIKNMIQHVVNENGIKHVGFVGSTTHCLSFYERWSGFCLALQECNLPLEESACIIDEDDSKYWEKEWLIEKVLSITPFPELFVCANDALAIKLMSELKANNIRIPEDVLVTGFDNSPESRVVEPRLTTVNVPSSDMGVIIAKRLLDCVHNPSLPHITSYVRSEIIMRESTNRKLRSKI